MNKFSLSVMTLLAACSSTVKADNIDSLRVEQLQEVVVKGVKAQKDAPFAVANIKRQELQNFGKTARELPFLFSQTPGVTAWSENGLGIGTTHMRIRGAGGSRINVTLDGIQLNSPEDQTVFWANMNSYSKILGSVQIQRGVGTSTNGDGAFGGNIALQTKTANKSPELEITGSCGSYNTLNIGGQFSTGILWNHLVFNGAYHHTSTDGFMHGTSGKSGSYYGGLTWLDNNFIVSYKNIGNYENTGQAWNGLDTGDLLDGNYGVKTGLNSYKDFWNAGMGRYNSLYEYLNDASDPSKGTSRYKMKDGSFWQKTTDNFWQNHNILSAAIHINEHLKTSATLRYTYGYGYYEDFKYNYKPSKFGLSGGKTDFVRKKGLDQNTYSAMWNINYKDENWDVVGGISVQKFTSNHFGYLTYIADEALSAQLLSKGNYKYYNSDADKFDGNTYLKATYNIGSQWKVFADVQYRHVDYKTNGVNDKFTSAGQHVLDIHKKYDFFNPKAGVSFSSGGHRAYASVATSHREPERNNFTDNQSYPAPKAEELTDFELGYNYAAQNWHIGLNAYYMKYDNQFVQTGEKSDIGEYITTNIKDSYRLGLELTADWTPIPWLTVYGNAALSQNKIKDFDEVVEDWDNKTQTIHYSNSTLAMSPSTILNGFATIHKGAFTATWHTNFVSKQYLDNTRNDQRSLPSYSQSDLSASYSFKLKGTLKELIVSAYMNNVFDAHYAASGWVYSAIYASGGHTNDNRYRQIGYMPMAGRNVLANITLRF